MKALGLYTITDRHLNLLAKMVRMDYFQGDVKNIIQRAAQGHCVIWEHGDGIFITTLIQHPKGLEVFVTGIENLGPSVRSAYSELKEYARSLGARWLGGEMGNPRFRRVFEKLNAKEVGIRFTQEV